MSKDMGAAFKTGKAEEVIAVNQRAIELWGPLANAYRQLNYLNSLRRRKAAGEDVEASVLRNVDELYPEVLQRKEHYKKLYEENIRQLEALGQTTAVRALKAELDKLEQAMNIR